MSLLLKSWFGARTATQPGSTDVVVYDPATQHHLATLERRAAELHQHLQSLLDIQAERLAGFSGDSISDTVTPADTLSWSLDTGRKPILPKRQPQRRQTSLRAARRGIKSAMEELLMLKKEEEQLIDTDVRQSKAVLKQTEYLEGKRSDLHDQVNSIRSGQEGARIEELTQEDQRLQDEVERLRLQLDELSSKQRAINIELSMLENSLQSRLSSYRASLSLMDVQISDLSRNYSRNLPASAVRSTGLGLEAGMLGRLREHERHTVQALEERQTAIKTELKALEGGIITWADVLAQVRELENYVAVNLGTTQYANSLSSADSQPLVAPIISEPKDLDLKMSSAIMTLEKQLYEAQDHGWNLLVCSIGAELEALRNARDYLAQKNASSGITESQIGGSHEIIGDHAKPAFYSDQDSDHRPKTNSHESIALNNSIDFGIDDPDPDILLVKPYLD